MVGSITFGGIVSQMDTDSIVKALVDLRRTTITGLETQAKELSYYKSVLRTANNYMLNLQQSMLNLRLESTFKSKTVSLSNENYFTASVGFDATPRSYIMQVNQLARGASATSGLGNRLFERGAAALVQGNTAGISAAEVTEENLSGVRARLTSLITSTLQAGRGDSAVSAGDQITITGTAKDTTAVSATFTFNGNDTDTLQRLANTIQSAFKGDVDVDIDSNGALVLVEHDTSVAGNFALTGLNFVDSDYSGSTLSIGIGESIASGGAQAQVLTGTKTFTTGSSSTIATALTALDHNLDQITGGDLDDGDDRIHITGKQHDGTEVDTWYTYTAGDTFQQLMDSIVTAYGSTVTASMQNGKIVLTDTTTGSSELSLSLAFDDAGVSENDMSFGYYITSQTGADSTAQIIKTDKFEDPAIGKYLLNFSDGKGGQVTGTVSLNENTLLGNVAGLTDYNVFTIDRDTGSGASSPVTILGLNERSSVRDFVNAINAQVPDVTAGLVSDGAGQYFLQITANRGGEELRLTDTAGGILENLINPSVGSDTDWTTANSSTDTTDYTATATFTADSGVPGIFRTIVAGDEGTTIDNLITNMSIGGGDTNVFNNGFALLYTNESSELNIQPSTHAHIIGAAGISSSSTTPRLNVLATLAEAGFAETPQNGIDNEVFHTDGFFTINGKRIDVGDVDDMTVNEMIGAINSSGAGVIASYDSATDRFILRASSKGQQSITLGAAGDTSNFLTIAGLTENAGGIFQTGNEKGKVDPEKKLAFAGLTFLPGSGTFTINGVKIYVDQSVDTLNSVIQKINNSGAGVIAAFDQNTDRMTLTQDLNSEVSFDQITVGDASDTSAFLAAMRLTNTPSASLQVGSTRQEAQLEIDGTTYYRQSNRIDDIIQDVTLNLKSVTQNPVSMDITVDTDKGLNALAEFVAEYNSLMDLINPSPLSTDEREGLVELTTEEINAMTLSEYEDYETNRNLYQQRDMIFNDSALRRANYAVRSSIFDPVASITDQLKSLGSLGINTGLVNSGIAESKSFYLVDDTTDVEKIKEALSQNTELVSNLSENSDEVLDLFANPLESEIEVTGSEDILYGITVTSGLRFQIGTGSQIATVNFTPGSYSYSDVVNRVRDALANANISDDIYVGLDSQNHILLRNTAETGKANIYVFDLSAGDSLNDKLGLTSGTFRGQDAEASAGLSVRLDNMLKSYTGVGGIIQARVTTGGQIDREIGVLANAIDDYETRLDQYEERLRLQFVAMEKALAQYQQTSQFLSSKLASSSSDSSGSYSY
jgi:flagellar capping protein FliD